MTPPRSCHGVTITERGTTYLHLSDTEFDRGYIVSDTFEREAPR